MTERRSPEVCAAHRRPVGGWTPLGLLNHSGSPVAGLGDLRRVWGGVRGSSGHCWTTASAHSAQVRAAWRVVRVSALVPSRRRTPSAAVRTPVPARRSVGAAGRPQDREDNEGDPVRRELAPPRTDPVQMAPDEAGDQVQGRGVRSTASLASLRPVPVVARYRLIAWILRPGPVRPAGNARGVEEHDEDDKRQCCDSLGREPSSVAFARSGSVCTNLSGRPETRKRHAG